MTAQTLLEVGCVAIIALVVALVTTLTSRNVLVMVSGLALLAVSSFVFPAGPAVDPVQKGAVLALLVLLAVRVGARFRWIATGAFLVLSASLALALLPQSGLFTAPADVAWKAYLGYLLPWLFLFLHWRPEQAQQLLRAVAYLPAVTIPVGLALQALHLWTIVSTADGTPRLEGSSIPAHLALMAVAGVMAATVELVRFDSPRHAGAWLVIDLVILVGTVTRGGIIAAAIVVIALALWSFRGGRARSSSTRRAARLPALLLVTLLAAALPLLLQRSAGNSYEGAFNTSGREQAWPFYFGLGAANPLIGRGLGFANIAQAYYDPTGVQALTAPHNEYLHLFVDGGVLLEVGYLGALLAAFIAAAGALPKGSRMIVGAILLAVLTYAATDNPFSTPQFSVPLLVVVSAIIASRSAPIPAVQPPAAPRGATVRLDGSRATPGSVRRPLAAPAPRHRQLEPTHG